MLNLSRNSLKNKSSIKFYFLCNILNYIAFININDYKVFFFGKLNPTSLLSVSIHTSCWIESIFINKLEGKKVYIIIICKIK